MILPNHTIIAIIHSFFDIFAKLRETLTLFIVNRCHRFCVKGALNGGIRLMRTEISPTAVCIFSVVDQVAIKTFFYELFKAMTHEGFCLFLLLNGRRRLRLDWLTVGIEN